MSEELSLVLKDELLQSITKFEELAKNVVITTTEARDAVDSNLKIANNLKKAITDFVSNDAKDEYGLTAKDHFRIHKQFKVIENKYNIRIDSCVSSFKKALMAFDAEEAKRKEAERLRLQAIADEQARKERERLLKQAEKLKTPEKKEALIEQAAMVESAQVQVVEPEKPKGSSYIKETWKAKVVDFAKLPDYFKLPNQKLLDDNAQSTKGTAQIPGVEFYSEKTLVSGRG